MSLMDPITRMLHQRHIYNDNVDAVIKMARKRTQEEKDLDFEVVHNDDDFVKIIFENNGFELITDASENQKIFDFQKSKKYVTKKYYEFDDIGNLKMFNSLKSFTIPSRFPQGTGTNGLILVDKRSKKSLSRDPMVYILLVGGISMGIYMYFKLNKLSFL